MLNKMFYGIYGALVGDAFGVPYEFKTYLEIPKFIPSNYVTGTHNQPPGTYSDDGSMMLCLIDSIVENDGYDPKKTAKNYAKWYYNGLWGAHGKVFDVGIQTSRCINRIIKGDEITGEDSFSSNGNGSLMRILPLAFFNSHEDMVTRFRLVEQESSITHSHPISIMCCFYYCEYIRLLMLGYSKEKSYSLCCTILDKLSDVLSDEFKSELNRDPKINVLFDGSLLNLTLGELNGNGYVLNTLISSLWIFITTKSYIESVKMAVGLGSDTDTTACVTGGLSGFYYSEIDPHEFIPSNLFDELANKHEICSLLDKFFLKNF